jgi:hypothetical protein
MFAAESTTNLVLQMTWLLALVNGGLHVFTFAFDIYLITVFRKISNMPPDMNPLEDNLTSRRANKHKYKNSEVTASTISISSPTRSSANLMPEKNWEIPFVQTRNESRSTFSPHNPKTAEQARLSQTQLSMYSQPQSSRTSHIDLHRRDGSVSPSKRGTLINVQEIQSQSPVRHSTLLNAPSHRASFHNTFSDMSFNLVGHSQGLPSIPARSGTSTPVYTPKDALLSDNWFVHADDEADIPTPPSHTSKPAHPTGHTGYAQIPNIEIDRDTTPEPQLEADLDAQLHPEPLRMNPPSPAPIEELQHLQHIQPPPTPLSWNSAPLQPLSDPQPPPSTTPTHLAVGDIARGLTINSTLTSSSRYSTPPASPSRSPLPRSRYYGDLASAQEGIRGQQGGTTPPLRKSPAGTPRSEGSRPRSVRRVQPSQPMEREGNPRVVSRSGVDLGDATVMYGGEDGWAKGRREVSGKVVEEGRSSWMRRREPSGKI